MPGVAIVTWVAMAAPYFCQSISVDLFNRIKRELGVAIAMMAIAAPIFCQAIFVARLTVVDVNPIQLDRLDDAVVFSSLGWNYVGFGTYLLPVLVT